MSNLGLRIIALLGNIYCFVFLLLFGETSNSSENPLAANLRGTLRWTEIPLESRLNKNLVKRQNYCPDKQNKCNTYLKGRIVHRLHYRRQHLLNAFGTPRKLGVEERGHSSSVNGSPAEPLGAFVDAWLEVGLDYIDAGKTPGDLPVTTNITMLPLEFLPTNLSTIVHLEIFIVNNKKYNKSGNKYHVDRRTFDGCR